MSSQERGKRPNEASPLSLLVDVADSRKSAPGGMRNGAMFASGKKPEESFGQTSRTDRARNMQAAVRAEEAFRDQRSSLLSLLGGSGFTDPSLLRQQAAALEAAAEMDFRAGIAAQLHQAAQNQNQDLMLARAIAQQNQQQATQNPDFMLARAIAQQQLGFGGEAGAAQQDDQASALAFATEMDIRAGIAAQLRQAAQNQNQDLLLARAIAQQNQNQQQLGFGGLGMDRLHELQQAHELEEFQRRQLLISAVTGQSQLNRQQLEDSWALQRTPDVASHRTPMSADALPTSHAKASTSKKSKKPPGSVVVPCRARGMPVDHNFKTAYFIIRENAQHGEELMCSYHACRITGIKFRYCAYCNVPVAKRNFGRRHQHGEVPDGGSQSGDDTASMSSADEEESKTPYKAVKQVKTVEKSLDKTASMTADDNKGATDSTAVKQENKVMSSSNPEEQRNNEADESDEAGGSRRSSITSSSAESQNRMTNNRMTMSHRDSPSLQPPIALRTIDADRAAQQPPIALRTNDDDRATRWAALLAKRPQSDDSIAMQAWLVEVLSVSDMPTPVKDEEKNGGENDKANTIGEETSTSKSKASLLTKKRPLSMVTVKVDESSSRAGDTGFAEWKEHKKYKGLPKKGCELAQKE